MTVARSYDSTFSHLKKLFNNLADITISFCIQCHILCPTSPVYNNLQNSLSLYHEAKSANMAHHNYIFIGVYHT